MIRQDTTRCYLKVLADIIMPTMSSSADELEAEEMHFDIHVVHVHHGLRETAGDDLAFVKKLCGQAGVPCSIERVDAAGCARRWGVGVEEAARTLRYQAFRRVCGRLAQQRETGKGFRIAVAHHREDQAETVLFHLCRGTDLRGARGMQPVNGDIIRPLLQTQIPPTHAIICAGRSSPALRAVYIPARQRE